MLTLKNPLFFYVPLHQEGTRGAKEGGGAASHAVPRPPHCALFHRITLHRLNADRYDAQHTGRQGGIYGVVSTQSDRHGGCIRTATRESIRHTTGYYAGAAGRRINLAFDHHNQADDDHRITPACYRHATRCRV